MRDKRIVHSTMLMAIVLLLIAGAGVMVYAAPAGSDPGKEKSDVKTLFDPFTLARITIAPDRTIVQPVLLGSRGGNNGNRNGDGNGKRPPVVVPHRPVVRSVWAPPVCSRL